MDAKTEALLLKARKGATAGFEAKQWETVLAACGFRVNRNSQTFIASHPRSGETFVETKREGYKRITFYDLPRALKKAGLDLELLVSEALGLPTLAEEAEAKKQEAIKESGRGTCQCCFGGFKSRDDVKLVLHGYERPGNGYVVGRCMGEGHPPFEVSCEQTKKFRQRLESIKAEAIAYKGRLEGGDVNLLTYHNKKYGIRETVDVLETIVRGAERLSQHETGNFYDTPSFEQLLKMEISQVDSKITHLNLDIAFLTRKIDGWTPVEWPVKKG